MSVGDVISNERGSAARFNTGKPPFELIPVWVIAQTEAYRGRGESDAQTVLEMLGSWQRGKIERAPEILAAAPMEWWADCARVFDYGRNKYAAWNWAKGMAWSVPTACAVRHLLAILAGEEEDPESGLPHRGHVMCNLVMLAQYEMTYREGDDRPTQIMQAA